MLSLSFPKPTWIPLVMKMRYKASRAVPHDADKSLHNSGTGGELWVLPRKHHTLPRQNQARQMLGGFKRKSKACHLNSCARGPNRNQTTGGLEQKLPITILECSSQGQLGETQGVDVQSRCRRVKCMGHQEAGEDGRPRCPLGLHQNSPFLGPEAPSCRAPMPVWVAGF